MKVKIDIFSGFLGAGKTFLIKKLIKDGAYEENIAIIENEFGEVSIDALILRESNIKIKEINSGCICCEVTGDFENAILEVIEKYDPSRLIIEPSGVAKLSDILKVFKEEKLKDKVYVDNVITVIDPQKFDLYINNFKDFYEDQIIYSKKIILSRTQKIKKEKLDEIILKINKISKKSIILTEEWSFIDFSEILGSINPKNINENKTLKPKLRVIEKSNAKDTFETFAIYPEKKISKAELVSKFKFISSSNIFGEVLRAKGIVKLTDGSLGQFDFVKDEFEIRKISNSKNTVISFIGVKLNKKEIEGLFNLGI
ncbi:GTP-binding protein [Clostridium sp. Sa3CUN1]|uniref:GTP-binding protein n=1 Tax=Clostridium gallinarum TaxID=2762246 RepID=A0ABR8Q8E3_9CLOT|nr:CobW family GTP-binding protein [Clostridium gallinarum]MBD7916524.1 GTP-binding protein [Clostridium gallinarum]